MMKTPKLLPALLTCLLASVYPVSNSFAAVGPKLLAIGSIDGNRTDLSTKTAGLLENGLAGNLLGGVGSGFAWAGGNTFITTPDRGPNATAYNPLIDNTTSYIARFQTIQMQLTKNTGPGLAYNLTPVLTATTLLSSATPLVYGTGAMGTGTVNNLPYTLGSGAPALNVTDNTNYFTGRSDNFDPTKTSANPNNGRFDPEGVRVSNDGKSVFISDEYGPYIYQFDRTTGERIKSFALPGKLAVANLSATENSEISGNTSGRVTNKGMEGLAITPDGKTLVGIMQASLAQDVTKNLRIVTVDIATGVTHEYAYLLTTGSGVSEIVALNDHQFLVDERDGKGLGDGSKAKIKQIFKIDIGGAEDVTNLSGDLSAKAVKKELLLDIVTSLKANGYTDTTIPAKIEGMAFGEDIMIDGVNTHTLYITNDNDFVKGVAGDNKFFVFGVTDTDLQLVNASFTAQNIDAPETVSLMLAGLALIALSRRQKKQ